MLAPTRDADQSPAGDLDLLDRYWRAPTTCRSGQIYL